jgi:hypothetical protein
VLTIGGSRSQSIQSSASTSTPGCETSPQSPTAMDSGAQRQHMLLNAVTTTHLQVLMLYIVYNNGIAGVRVHVNVKARVDRSV